LIEPLIGVRWRLLCFEAVIIAIETGYLLDVREHPNPQRYPEQRILIKPSLRRWSASAKTPNPSP